MIDWWGVVIWGGVAITIALLGFLIWLHLPYGKSFSQSVRCAHFNADNVYVLPVNDGLRVYNEDGRSVYVTGDCVVTRMNERNPQ